ncbi:hypothetical protein J4460_04375 [Candidatus Woesearchaeota archaeon]|nr:hypothetical protein [Candidatus Woesearchaeota archaeon]HIH37730.1 hypothetical protein [Candidatus Woesearchaeota archaeon]HIH48370.1 hypothetical protein [Candidatus Woesearchaeota archaeon]HIJ02683.1 hypothetical protein [Candidatus Woesearchaeota archaeon]
MKRFTLIIIVLVLFPLAAGIDLFDTGNAKVDYCLNMLVNNQRSWLGFTYDEILQFPEVGACKETPFDITFKFVPEESLYWRSMGTYSSQSSLHKQPEKLLFHIEGVKKEEFVSCDATFDCPFDSYGCANNQCTYQGTDIPKPVFSYFLTATIRNPEYEHLSFNIVLKSPQRDVFTEYQGLPEGEDFSTDSSFVRLSDKDYNDICISLFGIPDDVLRIEYKMNSRLYCSPIITLEEDRFDALIGQTEPTKETPVGQNRW